MDTKQFEIKFIKFEDPIGEFEDSEIIEAYTKEEALKKFNIINVSQIVSVVERPAAIKNVLDTVNKINETVDNLIKGKK